MKQADNKALIAAAQGVKAQAQPKSLNTLLETYSGEVQKALGGIMPTEKFIRIIATEVKSNDQLWQMAQKNPLSVIASAIKIAQWGLNPSIPNEVALIPWGGKTQAVTPMLGYKGLMKLALQAATELGIAYKKFDARVIYQHDVYERGFGTDTFIRHEPPKFGEPRGPAIGFYAIAEDQYGRVSHEEMTMPEARTHYERFCRSAGKGPWGDPRNFDRYGVKTVVRLLVSRHLPMTPKMSLAVKEDIAMDEKGPEGIEHDELPAIDVSDDVRNEASEQDTEPNL